MDAEVQEVTETLRIFIAPGQVTELRALEVMDGRYPQTVYGFFDWDHLHIMAAEAVRLTKRAVGVYFVPNAIDPAILARCANKTKSSTRESSLTKDVDIIERKWVLVDADPVRPDGISATEAEKAAALQVIQDVRVSLVNDGFRRSVLADSGNGYHLMYPVSWPTDDDGITREFLTKIAEKFDTPKVKIDRKVFNPSRIVKLYGTMSSKGDSTTDRPHRRTTIIDNAT